MDDRTQPTYIHLVDATTNLPIIPQPVFLL